MKNEKRKVATFKKVSLSAKNTPLIKGGTGTVTILDTDMESINGMEHDLEGFTKSSKSR